LPTKKFLHVGKFATDTDPNAVLKYVSTKLKVDASSLTVVKLVKKDVDVTILKLVNFKLGIPDHLYDSSFFCKSFLTCRSLFRNNIGICLPVSLRSHHLLSLS